MEDRAAEALGAELARTVSTIERILTDAATPARLYDVLARRRKSTPPIADPSPNQPAELRMLLRELRAEVLRSLGWSRPAVELGAQSKPLLTRACKKLITSWVEAPEAFKDKEVKSKQLDCRPQVEPRGDPRVEKINMRVIFLDCDGVLANSRSAMFDYELGDQTLIHDHTGMNVPLEKQCLAELQRVVASTGAVVVLSTTWRLDPAMRNFLVSCLAPVRNDQTFASISMQAFFFFLELSAMQQSKPTDTFLP